MKNAVNLTPCPKCGGRGELGICFTINGYLVPLRWEVFCEDCGFHSISKGTKRAAIKSWDRGE